MKKMTTIGLTFGLASIASLAVGQPAYAEASAPEPYPCTARLVDNIEYGHGTMIDAQGVESEVKLRLDAYLPECSPSPLTPVNQAAPVLLIHGGGFIEGTRKKPQLVNIGTRLAQEGFAAFSITYRLTDVEPGNKQPKIETLSDEQIEQNIEDATPPAGAETCVLDATDSRKTMIGAMAAVEDAIKAKAFITENASRFGISPARFGALGSSAGAATVLNLAYGADDSGFGAQGMTSVVDLSGALCPVWKMENGESSLLIVHGTADGVVPFANAEALAQQAELTLTPYRFIPMPNTGHVVDVMNQTVPGKDYTVMDAIVRFFEVSLR